MALLHVNFYSEILEMDTALDIVMPEKKQEIGQAGMAEELDTEEYPVMWLLHGRSNDETMWQRKTSIERYAGPLGFIVIMPSASYSCYKNMMHGPQYYDYFTKELPKFCKRLLPKMSRQREKNYLAGLSMGGGGSMYIGLNNTEQYGHICMLSTGGVPPLESLWRKPGPDGKIFVKTNVDIYGEGDTDVLKGTEHDILKLIRDTAEQAEHFPTVYHAMGDQDPRMGVALAIKETFESISGNPFCYEFHHGPGAHEWNFWDTWIKEYMSVIEKQIKGEV